MKFESLMKVAQRNLLRFTLRCYINVKALSYE